MTEVEQSPKVPIHELSIGLLKTVAQLAALQMQAGDAFGELKRRLNDGERSSNHANDAAILLTDNPMQIPAFADTLSKLQEHLLARSGKLFGIKTEILHQTLTDQAPQLEFVHVYVGWINEDADRILNAMNGSICLIGNQTYIALVKDHIPTLQPVMNPDGKEVIGYSSSIRMDDCKTETYHLLLNDDAIAQAITTWSEFERGNSTSFLHAFECSRPFRETIRRIIDLTEFEPSYANDEHPIRALVKRIQSDYRQQAITLANELSLSQGGDEATKIRLQKLLQVAHEIDMHKNLKIASLCSGFNIE